jgi:hypothetical protein
MLSRTLKILGITIGAAGFCVFSTMASAAVVCSGNVCWHTHERYEYPPEARIVVHDDDWKVGPDVKIREHEGRGYWRGDTWVEVK